MQGDTLKNLVDLAAELVELLRGNETDEAKEVAAELHDLLASRLKVYKETLEAVAGWRCRLKTQITTTESSTQSGR